MIGGNSLKTKKLMNVHRSFIRQLQKAQKIRKHKCDKKWSNVLGRDVLASRKVGSGSSTNQISQTQSKSMSHSEFDQNMQQNLSSLFGLGGEENDDNMFAGIENETHAKDQSSLTF
jgi:hypothetical protein